MTLIDLCRTWTKEQILDDLASKGKTQAIELFNKFLVVGWKGLNGGNVIFMPEMTEEDVTTNQENQYAAAIRLIGGYGWMTPDIFYLPRCHFDDIMAINQTPSLK
jgi:hypothetical protein